MVKEEKTNKTEHIVVSTEFKEWISSKGLHGESYEQILKRLVNFK